MDVSLLLVKDSMTDSMYDGLDAAMQVLQGQHFSGFIFLGEFWALDSDDVL